MAKGEELCGAYPEVGLRQGVPGTEPPFSWLDGGANQIQLMKWEADRV